MFYQVLKHEARPSDLGLDATRIANFVNYLLKKRCCISIHFYPLQIFSLQVFQLRKSVINSSRACILDIQTLIKHFSFVFCS